jgi:hypothetical protein
MGTALSGPVFSSVLTPSTMRQFIRKGVHVLIGYNSARGPEPLACMTREETLS